MSWHMETEVLSGGAVRRVRLLAGGAPVAYSDVIAGWRDDPSLRAVFIGFLAAAPYAAYLWETPPVSRDLIQRDFACVLIDSPALAAMAPEPEAFADRFAGAAGAVAAFANLGGDAHLVAPRPEPAYGAYPHLADFARAAPAARQHDFWRRVGAEAAARIGARPLWISTCGLGVAWLHVRLDSRPKYYRFEPYRRVGTA